MDKLDVIRKSEELGGPERRSALEILLVAANKLGCQTDPSGGRGGGINVRYGSIGYAIMDVATDGGVKLYVQPHPTKPAPEALVATLNAAIQRDEALAPKSFPLNVYGQLLTSLENIPASSLQTYLQVAIDAIRDTYYSHSTQGSAR